VGLKIEETQNKENVKSFAFFALGFRPFFFFAAIFSLLIISFSLVQFSENIILSSYYTLIGWHAHEMLFGYTVAVIAGFLLTAVGNWTGIKMINGWQLILVSIVFVMGRFSPLIPDLPHSLVALSDFAFIPLLALIISVPIIRVKQWSNFIFIPLLLAMAMANLLVHLSALGLMNIPIETGSRIMLYLVVLLIVIMGGRVIPFFTERGIKGVTVKKWIWIERLSPLSIILLLVSDIIPGDQLLTAYVALFAALIHSIRLFGWYSNNIWQVPLIWILHVAYSWFIVGFIIQGLAIFSINESQLAYHALTVGGIGIMTLGMMARVSLGHTGREMKLNNWMFLSFILINVAAVIRVIVPLIIPENYLYSIQLAGGLWVVAFLILVWVFTPIWIHPRIDGREG